MKIEVQIGCEFGYADFFLGKFVFLQENMWMWLPILGILCIVCLHSHLHWVRELKQGGCGIGNGE